MREGDEESGEREERRTGGEWRAREERAGGGRVRRHLLEVVGDVEVAAEPPLHLGQLLGGRGEVPPGHQGGQTRLKEIKHS